MDSNQSPLADPVFYRTYSRRQGSDRETWAQATDRAIGGLIKLGKFTPAESDLLRDQCLRMRALPAGRWLWVGGTPWIEAPENYPGAFNCHNSHLRPSPLEETGSPWEVMGYLMQLAMVGCGVGRVCSLAGAAEFPLISRSINVRIVGNFGDAPRPDRQDETTYAILSDGPRITIGDSRQGWADAYQSLLEIASGHHPIAHADPGHPIEVAVDISHVRPSGERLAGFGGVANPIKLPDLFGRVAKILNHAIGRKLTPLELALISDEAALVVVAGNVRRCLPADALVHTAKGLVPIEDVQVGDFVQTPIGFRRVAAKFDQGTQDVYEIETNATTLRSTLNHRHAVFSSAKGQIQWKLAGDLTEHDRLVHSASVLPGLATNLPPDFTHVRPESSRTAKAIAIPSLTPDIAWLIGFTHGNGYVQIGRNKHNKPVGAVAWSMNSAQPDLMAKIRSRIDQCLAAFGLSACHSVIKNENTGVSRCSSIRLAEYFHRYIKQPKSPIVVPDWILQSTSEIRAAYLAGLVDSDGSICTRPPVLVTTVYLSFLRQVGAVLSSLGIAGRVKASRPDKDHWQARYSITIPAFKSQYNAMIAPYSAKGEIREGLKMYGFNFSGELARASYACSELRRMGFEGSRSTPVNYESLMSKSDREVDIPVTVKGIGSYDHVQTYDIEVEGAHCFYVNGYLTHNSAGMVQFDSEDTLPVDWLGVNAATAKHGLWVQGEDGSWAIDPNRDALRMSNHTKVFMRRPTEQECIESVRSQYYSGEGAIQYAPEEIARANRDLLDTPEKRRGFFRAIEIGPQSAKQYLLSLMPPLGTDDFEAQRQRDQELDHRVDRYGLNPCFGAGTMIMVRKPDGDGFTQHPIESLIGKTVEVFDGERWVVIDNFRVTGRNRPMLRIELQSGQSVRTTEHHDFILEDGTRKKTKDLDVGDRLLHMTDDEGGNDLGWFYTVAAIAPDGVDAEVYCCTVPTNHQITLGSGLITGQCGEATGSDFFCNLSTVCLNQQDPLDLEGQRKSFRAAGLYVAALLQQGFDRPRYQYSRSIDPIVLVSFTGGFDFFVKALGVDWLRWWEAGRPDWWVGTDLTIAQPIADQLGLNLEGYRILDWDEDDREISTDDYQFGDFYRDVESAYLSLWRSTVEQTIWEYCDRHGLRRPNRCTGLKPEGTLSLLTGASPGWHPPKAARFIRRVTFAKNDPIALACLDHGYSIVPSQSDKDENGNLLNDPFDPRCTEWLVEIPVAVSWADLPGADTIAIEKFSALAQFDFWMQVQKHYTTHSTSATIELRESEIEPLGQRIYQAIQEDEGYISAALLARFDDLQTFPRLPFEPISRETYLELQSAVEARRKPGIFAEHLARHDQGDQVAASEQGPAGCDSDRCLLPERK